MEQALRTGIFFNGAIYRELSNFNAFSHYVPIHFFDQAL
jgi:hypothetical protein